MFSLSYYDGSKKVDITNFASTKTSCSTHNSHEGPAQAVDGNINTKFLCYHKAPVNITVVFNEPSLVQSYDIKTANDEPDRDPKSWVLSCRSASAGPDTPDSQAWETLDVRSVQSAMGRKTSLGPFDVYGKFPTSPANSCWFVMPSGCPNHQNGWSYGWVRDTTGEQEEGRTSSGCDKRKSAQNGWCDTNDAKIYFVK